MVRFFAMTAVWAAMLWHPVAVPAHGVGSREMDPGAAKAMAFLYADGEPMAFAQVQVTAPGPDGGVHQSARADALGRFAFVPSGPGLWLVTAADGQGHRAVREVLVADRAASLATAVPSASGAARTGIGPGWREATLGLSLLANIGLLAALLRRRPG